MAKFDVYGLSSLPTPFLIDLQDDIIDNLSTRVVAPLIPADEVHKKIRILNPVIDVNGEEYVMMTHLLAAIPASELLTKVANMTKQRDDIIAALDFLFTGF